MGSNLSSKKLDFPEINLRMEKILAKIGLKKQNEAAKILGFSESYLSQMLTGAVSPSLKILKILHQKSGCNYHWLLTGEGPMDAEQRQGAGMFIETSTPYGDLSPGKEEIALLLQENLELKEICQRLLRLLGNRKVTKETLVDLQKRLDLSPPESPVEDGERL
jgi:transcriptional regulator with XRE-family HTH domain